MSTKIYNAWRSVKPIRTVEELVQASVAIRAALRPASARAFYRVAAAYACEHIDTQIAFGRARTSASTALLNRQIAAQKKSQEGIRDPEWDTEITWAFLPAPDGRILLKVFGEAAAEEAMSHVAGWEDYHFQNSVNKPRGISQRAWRKRERDWDTAMGNDTYGTRGLTASLWSDGSAPHVWDRKGAAVRAHQASLTTRARLTAKRVLMKRYFKDHPLPKDAPPHDHVGILLDFEKWLPTEVGIKAWATEIHRITPLLPPRITRAEMTKASSAPKIAAD